MSIDSGNLGQGLYFQGSDWFLPGGLGNLLWLHFITVICLTALRDPMEHSGYYIPPKLSSKICLIDQDLSPCMPANPSLYQ